MRRLLLSMFLCMFAAVSIVAQTTAFSYQGSLKDGANPANGNFDFEFKLFDALSAGTQQGGTQQRLNVAVANGVFAVSLDFGAGTLPGANRYLEIAVRTAGGGTFTLLTPRQPVNSALFRSQPQLNDRRSCDKLDTARRRGGKSVYNNSERQHEFYPKHYNAAGREFQHQRQRRQWRKSRHRHSCSCWKPSR